MRDLRRDNFGILIAYLLPGSVALLGASYHVEAVGPWLSATPGDAPSIGGFLFATLASTSLGMVISALRWALVDTLLARLGVRPPRWDFELFAERLAAYEFLIAHHYRYYQFYANMFVALGLTYASRLVAGVAWDRKEAWLAAGFAIVESVLFAGSWDTLKKYYARTNALLGTRSRRRRANREGPAAMRPGRGERRSGGRPLDGEPRDDRDQLSTAAPELRTLGGGSDMPRRVIDETSSLPCATVTRTCDVAPAPPPPPKGKAG